MSRGRLDILKRREPLRVGFLPSSDCAPLVYASEAGLFDKYGLDVQLQRETRWANIRDKVIYGDLDAAQAPATLPFLAGLGVESDPCACVTGLVLSLQGNAIVLSRTLWDQGVRDAAGLKERIHRDWGKRTYTLGVVFSFSCQELLLRRWLQWGRIAPDAAVRLVYMPPNQMFPTLKLGYIDGFCVAEPWASLAVQAGVGVAVATSADLAPLHPETVLMVRQSFATGRAEQHERLLAALLEACAFCQEPVNRRLLGAVLADSHYVNAPAECFASPATSRPGQGTPPPLTLFGGEALNEPTDPRARWLMDGIYEMLERKPVLGRDVQRMPVLKNVFRLDIFGRATKLAAAFSKRVGNGHPARDQSMASRFTA